MNSEDVQGAIEMQQLLADLSPEDWEDVANYDESQPEEP
jgi:hypothetical protein